MKVIDLLKDVAIGKIPKKIKINNQEYEHDGIDYKRKSDGEYLFSVFLKTTQHDLNMEVEIIEEPQEHKIPEKLKCTAWGDKDENGNYIMSAFPNNGELMNKINEILDYLEEIK